MSFGFPAYHQQTETFYLNSGNLYSLVKSAFAELRWKVTMDTPSHLEASATLNLASWGEKISVSIEGMTATIVSKCLLPTQCIDWGKNKKNVTTLLNMLRRLEHFENSNLAPASVNDGISPLNRLITENDDR
jgi:hypothetical protein